MEGRNFEQKKSQAKKIRCQIPFSYWFPYLASFNIDTENKIIDPKIKSQISHYFIKIVDSSYEKTKWLIDMCMIFFFKFV